MNSGSKFIIEFQSIWFKRLFPEQFSMKSYLAPKLSPSCVSYRDLFFDSTTNRVSMNECVSSIPSVRPQLRGAFAATPFNALDCRRTHLKFPKPLSGDLPCSFRRTEIGPLNYLVKKRPLKVSYTRV